jgi:RNA recognition motif-containing protein
LLTLILLVGNLSFFTTELQIHETFSVVGPVKRVIMGLNQFTKTPCGFCFVEYYTRDHAAAALKYINGTICDDRIVRCDLDCGFKPGRQFGRGPSGGQMRDERRDSLDPARGGIVLVPKPENKISSGLTETAADQKSMNKRVIGEEKEFMTTEDDENDGTEEQNYKRQRHSI